MNRKDFKELEDNAGERIKVTGIVIERFVIVEMVLDTLLTSYFVSYAPLNIACEFDRDLLRRELTFDMKLRVLRRLKLEKKSGFKFSKEIYNDLEWLQEKRNALVHNIKIFESDLKFKVEYYHNKKHKNINVDKSFGEEFFDRASKTEEKLMKVIDGLKGIKTSR